MKLDYTEFSFGYAFTENLILSYARLGSAPYFPNLRQEAKLGYDVCIDLPGCPLFFQYKLPELMRLKSAKEISQYKLKGIKTPFFRMHLMPKNLSDQHLQLINLEQNYLVYYAAPSMEDVDSFNNAYTKREVHNHSFLFSPRDIGELSDNGKHAIAYRNGLHYAWLCSEPREIRAFTFRDVEEKIRGSFNEPRYPSLENTAEEVSEKLLELASLYLEKHLFIERLFHTKERNLAKITKFPEQPEIDSRTRRVVRNLLVAREIALIAFGLEMVIAQPPKCRDALR